MVSFETALALLLEEYEGVEDDLLIMAELETAAERLRECIPLPEDEMR